MMDPRTHKMFADSLADNDNEANPVLITIDQINAWADDRYAWLSRAAAQIEAWNAEEEAALLKMAIELREMGDG